MNGQTLDKNLRIKFFFFFETEGARRRRAARLHPRRPGSTNFFCSATNGSGSRLANFELSDLILVALI